MRNNLTVAFHHTNATETAVGLPPYYTEWHTAVSQAWQSQLIGLVCHGVFDTFPELRVVMTESSWTWVPSTMWRLDHNCRSLRREVPSVKRMPSEYVRDQVRFTTQPMQYPENLYQMFEMIGSEEFLVFSTDYPHWDFDSPQHVFPKSFPKELRRKILAENARNFFDYLRAEMQRYVVCKREELRPGTARAVEVGGRRVAVACVEEGSYRAIADTCPHEMASFADGKVEKMWLSNAVGSYRASKSKCVIVCPWHTFEFDLDTGLSPCEPASASRSTEQPWNATKWWCTSRAG